MPIGPGFRPAQLPTGQKYFELPFNELLAGLSAKQKQYDVVAEANTDLEGLAPIGGLRTQDRASLLKNELNTKIEEFTNKLATGNLSILPQIKSFAKRFVTNPEYIDVKADELARPLGDKQLIEGNFPEYAQSWYDVNTKTPIQTKPGERFSAEWYQSMPPKDWVKEYQDNATLLKPLYENIAEVGFTKLDEAGQLYREIENGNREYLDENRLKEFLDPKGPYGNYVKTLYDARKEGHLFREAKHKQEGKDYSLEKFALENINANLIRLFDKTNTTKSVQKVGDGTKTSKDTEKESKVLPVGMDVQYTINSKYNINTEQDVQNKRTELTTELTEYKNELTNPESDLNKLFYGMFDSVPLPLKQESLGVIKDADGNEITVDKLPVINKDGIEYADIEKLKTYSQYIAPENKDKFTNQLDNIIQYNIELERANNNVTGFDNVINDLKLSTDYKNVSQTVLKEADAMYDLEFNRKLATELLYAGQGTGINDYKKYVEVQKKVNPVKYEEALKKALDSKAGEDARNKILAKDPKAKAYYDGLKALSSPSDIAGKSWMLAGFTTAEATAANGLTTYAKGRLTGIGNTTDIKFTKGNKPIHEHPDYEKKILPAINNFLQDAIGEEGEESANKMKNNTKLRWDEQDGWMLDVYIPGLREGAPDQNTVEIPINENDATQMSLVTNLFGNSDVQFGNNLQQVNADINDFGFFKDPNLNFTVTTTNKITNTDKGLYQNVRNVTGKLNGIEIKFNSVVDATQFYTDLKDFKTVVGSNDQFITDGTNYYSNTPETRKRLFYQTFGNYGLNELKLESIYTKNFQ